ncbi:Protein serine/threonine phosphatase PrpC, regulation of stationary phase [hydrothermal vent metagenome]|uniref:Protein serine/threonine phosphatase PrpC, regulation of stationary phase n=1 Tax=hydrothermal vent metagenome TaxID=652676 RepID=A0A3B0YMX4_9ZZZZ
MKYSSAQSSRLGNRSNNEDRSTILYRDAYILMIVVDGMGGHTGGEIAAQTTIDTFRTVFNNIKLPINNGRSFLQQVLQLSHHAIQERCREQVDPPRTTCVCCLIDKNHIIWAHSGDSRLYILRDKHVQYRTRDHSYVEDMLQQKTLTEQEAAVHPMRNYVTASLGGSTKKPHFSISEKIPLKTNDIILLCSDGLWSAFDDKEIVSMLQTKPLHPILEQSLDQLTSLADKKTYPHSDNTTAIAIKIEDHTSPNKVSTITITTDLNYVADPLKQAVEDIEAAYTLYKKEIK